MRQPWLTGLLIVGIVLGSFAILLISDRVFPTEAPIAGDRSLSIESADAEASRSEAEFLSSLKDLSFQEFVDAAYRGYLLRVPQSITLYGLGALLNTRHDRLNDFSSEAVAEIQRIDASLLNMLRDYDRAELSNDEQLTYDVCFAFWSKRVAAHTYAGFDYLVTHSINDSPDWLTYDLLTTYHPRSSLADIEDYITRLSLIATQLDQLIEGLEDRKQRGIVAPKPVLAKALSLLAIMAYGPLETHPVFFNVALMVVSNSDLSETLKRTIFTDAAVLTNTSVIPAYQRLYAKIAELEAIASDTISIQQIPEGAPYYEYLVHAVGETDLSGKEVHEWALDQIADCQVEIKNAVSAMGYSADEGIASLIQQIAADGGTTTAEGKPVAFGLQLSQAAMLSHQAIEGLPTKPLRLVVNPFSELFYLPAALDGSHEAEFSVPRMGEQPTYLIATRTFHETLPGLHALSFHQQNAEFPLLRQAESWPAHTLGWASYAERLAWELGAYADDSFDNIGRLVEELRQAVLVAVDTGIHAHGWTMDEALAYYIENTGDMQEEAQTAVLQVIAHPGSSLPGFTGFHKILELRARARKTQGDDFVLADFHSLVIENGSMPLEILEQRVQAVIDAAASN